MTPRTPAGIRVMIDALTNKDTAIVQPKRFGKSETMRELQRLRDELINIERISHDNQRP